jgi:hypothetical protein
VRYVGEPVAVVLGDSPALAEDGVGAIAIDIEELPPVPHRQLDLIGRPRSLNSGLDSRAGDARHQPSGN